MTREIACTEEREILLSRTCSKGRAWSPMPDKGAWRKGSRFAAGRRSAVVVTEYSESMEGWMGGGHRARRGVPRRVGSRVV